MYCRYTFKGKRKLIFPWLQYFYFFLYKAVLKSSCPEDQPEDYFLVEDTTKWLRDATGEKTPSQQGPPRALDPHEKIIHSQKSTQGKFFLCRKSEVSRISLYNGFPEVFRVMREDAVTAGPSSSSRSTWEDHTQPEVYSGEILSLQEIWG